MKPELKFIYSSMNSGKSLSILTKNYMLKQRGFRTVLMKSSVDTRSSSSITTRLGIEEQCAVLNKEDFASLVVESRYPSGVDFILVDESQFLTEEQVWDLAWLVDETNTNVHCYGLKLDWRGEFFSGSETLMKIADSIEAIENYCPYNKGALAFFHVKHGGSAEKVEIGEENLYESVSRKEWRKRTIGNKFVV